MINYLVTTNPAFIPLDQSIVMVDGTVPGWKRQPHDYHYDHHSVDGGRVQIDEMVDAPVITNATIVTTQLDADACVAAAWLQLDKTTRNTNHLKLWVIAHDCDYLMVPKPFAEYAQFAAEAVATMKQSNRGLGKQLGLPDDYTQWTESQRVRYYSESFRLSTQWLIDACNGVRDFPGKNNEAAEYWVNVNRDTLFVKNRVSIYKNVPVADLADVYRYIDPRSFINAISQLNDLLPMTLTIRPRKQQDGVSYTLGTNPHHRFANKIDYSRLGVWEALTKAERKLNPDFDKWGGRAVVGGSSWNNPSLLSRENVIDIVLTCMVESVV